MDSLNLQSSKRNNIANLLKEQKQLNVINSNAGKGGFGFVMFVLDKEDKEFAIKIISLFDGAESVCEKKLEAAKTEAEILKKCIHPNIVKYHDEFQIGFNYFILMEKCAMSLDEWSEQNKGKILDQNVFVNFALQMLDAVQYLHSQNYILRDLSLRNTLLDFNLQIKLCDFGLAKEINQEQASNAFFSSSIKGAPLFYPPEIIDLQGNSKQKFVQNREGDIWAFGICLYLLAGATIMNVSLLTYGQQEYQSQPKVDLRINKIIQNILQRNPKARPTIPQIIQSFKNLSHQPLQPLQSNLDQNNIPLNQLDLIILQQQQQQQQLQQQQHHQQQQQQQESKHSNNIIDKGKKVLKKLKKNLKL